MVDCVFSDVAQPDQARIVLLNSEMFLKATNPSLLFCCLCAQFVSLRRPAAIWSCRSRPTVSTRPPPPRWSLPAKWTSSRRFGFHLVRFVSDRSSLQGGFKPLEQMTLEPFERDHAVVTAVYRPAPKAGAAPKQQAETTTPRSEKKDKKERKSDKKESSKKKHKADKE